MENLSGPLGGLIIVFLLYVSGAILAVVMLAVGVAWGIRWGLTWALKEISKDSELEAWLKRALNASEKPDP
jgi:hypothetical protein